VVPPRTRQGRRRTGHAEFDAKAAILQADFGKLSVISLYLPSGSSSRNVRKPSSASWTIFYPHLVELAQSGRDVVVCGDWNIAHQEIDLKNWKGNRKNSGFLPEERAWITRVLEEGGWHDVYRRLYPEATDECYTWWSNRGQAWAKNVGWRLDYQLATPRSGGDGKSATIYKAQRFSITRH
jgi:exodeoxyribonuclease-3